MGVSVKYVNSKSEAEILALTPDDPKWYDQAFYYPNDVPIKPYYYRLIEGVMIPYGVGVVGAAVTGITINNKVIGGVKPFIKETETLDIPEGYDYNTLGLTVEGTINVEGQINSFSLEDPAPPEPPAPPPTIYTLIIKDIHSNLQEGVKVFNSSVLIGETSEVGEIVVNASPSTSLIIGKSGFFIKEYVVTSSDTQEIELNYVVPTVQIGGQIWQSENLAIDDLQGGTGYPDNNISNIANYGVLYNQEAINRHSNLVASFTSLTNNNIDKLIVDVGGSSVAGKALKEVGNTYWSAGNTGSNTYGFGARGAGVINLNTFTPNLFKERMILVGDSNVYIIRHNTDDIALGFASTTTGYSNRLIKTTTDTFIFSISVNSAGAAVQGATVTVEGNEYITDINGQVHIEEYKTSVNYTIEKAGYITEEGSIDLTTEFTKIITLNAI